MKVYIIGSLRNPRIPELAEVLRASGHEVFDDWFSAGPEADDKWREHQQSKGLTFLEALEGPAATNVFEFDKRWIEWADAVVLVLPAGKSGHLELGYALGKGKPGYILVDAEPERWDVMYRFATKVFTKEYQLLTSLKSKDVVVVNRAWANDKCAAAMRAQDEKFERYAKAHGMSDARIAGWYENRAYLRGVKCED